MVTKIVEGFLRSVPREADKKVDGRNIKARFVYNVICFQPSEVRVEVFQGQGEHCELVSGHLYRWTEAKQPDLTVVDAMR